MRSRFARSFDKDAESGFGVAGGAVPFGGLPRGLPLFAAIIAPFTNEPKFPPIIAEQLGHLSGKQALGRDAGSSRSVPKLRDFHPDAGLVGVPHP